MNDVENNDVVGGSPSGQGRKVAGSSIFGASLNFTNCIVGAGCIGYGGAIAQSGGLVSFVTMLFFAYMAKLSFDLLIELSIAAGAATSSYEALGEMAYGLKGRNAVVISKMVFSFGALVAIAVIVKDNFAPACRSLLGVRVGGGSHEDLSWWEQIAVNDQLSTLLLCTTVMLPICLLRDMAPLERFSAVKIVAFATIIFTVIYMTMIPDSNHHQQHETEGNFYSHWLQVRPGFIQSMGTYMFTFVAQHTCHLVYRSLEQRNRNLHGWKQVSTMALALSVVLSFPIGLFAYLTYWEKTDSNLFLLYPPSPQINVARVLLCLAMLLSYPMPFFSCRELIIISLPRRAAKHDVLSRNSPAPPQSAGSKTLGLETDALLITAPATTSSQVRVLDDPSSWFLPGEDTQLKRVYHVSLTTLLWAVSVFLALAAPSLGDVLNLVGCCMGTIIAFVLPGLFSFKIQGYSHVGASLLVVGGFVGLIGTYFSVVQLIQDAMK